MQYINIWTISDSIREETLETRVFNTVGEAAEDYKQIDYKPHYVGLRKYLLRYKHTLEFDLDAGICRAIDVSELDEDDEEEGLPYEPLTGHEMGVCPGRV